MATGDDERSGRSLCPAQYERALDRRHEDDREVAGDTTRDSRTDEMGIRSVDPRVERALGRFSEGFARVGDLPGDRSDGARIDEVAFLEDGSGSVEEVRI